MKQLFASLLIIAPLLVCAQGGEYPLETVVQNGHRSQVTCGAFSPDGAFVVTGSGDQTIKLWKVSTGKIVRQFTRHTGTIRSVVFSPDGKQLLSAGADNQIFIYDIISGNVIQSFHQDHDRLFHAVYSPDGKSIVSISDRDETTVWDIETGSVLVTHKKSFGANLSASWLNPDGSQILSTVDYKHACVRNTRTGEKGTSFEFEKTHDMTMSADGKYVVLGSTKLFGKVYDAQTGKELHRLKDNEEVKCDGCNTWVAISSDSRYVLTGAHRAGVILWDIKNGKKIRTLEVPEDRVGYLDFSPDGRLVMVSDDKAVRLYDAKSGKLKLRVANKFLSYYQPVFSPDGKYLLLPGANNKGIVWNTASGRKALILEGYLNKERDDGLALDHTNWMDRGVLRYIDRRTEIALSPDNTLIAKGKVDSVALIMEVGTGKILHTLVGHSKIVYAFDFSPDGTQLITAGGDRFMILWDVATGKEIRRFKGHGEILFDVRFNSDGTELISGSWDGTARLWDVESGEMTGYISLNNVSAYVVRYTPGDLYAVTGDLGKKVKFWELDSKEQFRTLVGHTDMLADLAFSPDGALGATGSWDGSVKIWDLLSGMITRKFRHNGGAAYAVAWDPNGKFLASAGSDRDIWLWDPKTGELLKRLKGHTTGVSSLAISSDSKRLISCSVDGVVKVWDLEKSEELYTHIQVDRNDWLVQNPYGFFDGSSKAMKMVNYVTGMEVVPVGSLFEKYYAPGLLKRIMSGEKFKDVGALDQMIKSSLTAELKVQSGGKRGVSIAQDSSYQWRNDKIPLTVEVSGGEGEPEEVRIHNNGKLIFNETFNEEIEFRGGIKSSRTFEVPLKDGVNNISAVVINDQRTESLPAELSVKYDGEAALTDLYIMSVGINQYKNPAYTLNYAVNDAETFTKTVRKGASTLFSKVHEYAIRNDMANKKEIRKTMDEIIAQAGPEDVFLFYYAGHGVMSMGEEESFYIVTHDITNLYGGDEILQEKAISAEELLEFSRRVLAEKQLFVLDACQSGGALTAFAQRGASREKALAQLARSTGTFFLTASQAIQYANEVGNLEHGMFTYALLEALGGTADGGTMDDKITVNELKTYVEERVPELSEKYQGSPQYPTSYSFGQDFPLVIVK